MGSNMNSTTADLIERLNHLLRTEYYDSAYDCATDNGLDLVHWFDESGGLYETPSGDHIFGWEWPHLGFDDQIDQLV